MMIRSNPVLWLLVAGFVVGVATLVWLLRVRRERTIEDVLGNSDKVEDLPAIRLSPNIFVPAWLLVLIVFVFWIFGLGMEHGSRIFDIGVNVSGYQQFRAVLRSQSTAGLWISVVIALLLFGSFALVRKLRNGQLPSHSSRLFLVILVGFQVLFVSSIQNTDESQAIREYLETYSSQTTSSLPIEVLRNDPVQAAEGLWLVRVYKQGSTTTFEFQFDAKVSSHLTIKELVRTGQSMGQNLADETCADTDRGRRELESGGTIKYAYLSANGKVISEVSVSKGDCGNSDLAVRNEAKAALLELAANQERHYLKFDTYTRDLKALGFPSDPYITPSGLYVIRVVPGADQINFIAMARYTGQDSSSQRCRKFSISGRGERRSAPPNACWN